MSTEQTSPPGDEGCICKGNWRAIVKETEAMIGQKFTDQCGREFTFFGVVHGADDYYYGMCNKGDVRLLSCAGSIETHGYSPSTKTGKEMRDEMNEQQAVPAVEVEFESLGQSKRRQLVRFDLGSDEANAHQIWDFAWKHNAKIVPSDTNG